MTQLRGYTATIDGYTDALGDPIMNRDLSEQRAKAVLNALSARRPAACRASSALLRQQGRGVRLAPDVVVSASSYRRKED